MGPVGTEAPGPVQGEGRVGSGGSEGTRGAACAGCRRPRPQSLKLQWALVGCGLRVWLLCSLDTSPCSEPIPDHGTRPQACVLAALASSALSPHQAGSLLFCLNPTPCPRSHGHPGAGAHSFLASRSLLVVSVQSSPRAALHLPQNLSQPEARQGRPGRALTRDSRELLWRAPFPGHDLTLTWSFLAKRTGCSLWGSPGPERSQRGWGHPAAP